MGLANDWGVGVRVMIWKGGYYCSKAIRVRVRVWY